MSPKLGLVSLMTLLKESLRSNSFSFCHRKSQFILLDHVAHFCMYVYIVTNMCLGIGTCVIICLYYYTQCQVILLYR